MYFGTVSSMLSRPYLLQLRLATAVNGFVTDAILNTVSNVAGIASFQICQAIALLEKQPSHPWRINNSPGRIRMDHVTEDRIVPQT